MALELKGDKIKEGYLALPEYQKILITFVALAILIGLFVWFMYMPKMADLESLETKLKGMESTVSQNRAVEASLPKFEAEHAKLGRELAKALTQLPSSDEIPRLLQDMEVIGNKASVEFKKLKLAKDIPRGFYVEVPVDLNLYGSYHDLATFFDRLSGLPRIINISRVNFSSPKSEKGKIMLNATCRASIFKFAEKKSADKGKKK
jgi:type IV pilus assembly protein PilO